MIKLPTKTLIAAAAGAMAALLVSVTAAPAAPAIPFATGIGQDRLVVDVQQRVKSGRKYNKHRRGNRMHQRSHRRGDYRHSRNRIQLFDVYDPWFGIVIGSSYRNDCTRSYRNWQRTGSRYWRSRYYDCRNG